MNNFKKDLLKIIESPLNELKKHGDILTISEKIGAFIFRYLFGIPIKYLFLPLIAASLLPFVLIFDLINGEKIEIKTNDKIDLSKYQFKIKNIIHLSTENISQGVKDDIYLFFQFNDSFTEELLNERYKSALKKYHPDRKLTGDREKFEECKKLYGEMIWHWFRSMEDKINNPNYPILRDKSYRHIPKFGLNQIVQFNNNTHNVSARVIRTSSCDGDEYLVVNDFGQNYSVKEEDLCIKG